MYYILRNFLPRYAYPLRETATQCAQSAVGTFLSSLNYIKIAKPDELELFEKEIKKKKTLLRRHLHQEPLDVSLSPLPGLPAAATSTIRIPDPHWRRLAKNQNNVYEKNKKIF